jgi:glycosyltransferase involved in cell wall biosynthesis
MIVLITSCRKNEEYRETLRQTWLKDAPFLHLFIIGGTKKTHIVDDILYVKSKDDYNSVPEKQFEAFKYCLKNYQFDNIFICDDDAYVCVDRLLDSDCCSYDYYGGGPVRMWDKPYYALGGPGITLSQKAVKEIADNGKEYLYQPVPHNVAICNVASEDQYWGDRFIGLTLDNAGINPHYDERFVDINLDPLAGKPKQYNNIISYHGKSNIPRIETLPEDIADMHQHFQETLKPIRVAMILDQWSKGGAEKEFADMILDADPSKIQYVGIALNIAWEFYIRGDLKGKLPPFHTHRRRGYEQAIDKDYLNLHKSFEQAIQEVTKEADVIIKWHTHNMFLENINKPSILLCNATSWYTESKQRKLQATKYVGNSDWSTKWLPKHAHEKLTIYSGHSEERVKPTVGRESFRKKIGFNDNDKVVAHIGRINLDKNIKLLCEAVSLLPEEWKLMLVGRIPSFNQEELDEILEKHIPNRYIIVPWVDYVGDAFAAADVFVLSSYYEGFSNALAEAWMSKTPTVFSRCGSADELIEKYGNIGIDIATSSSAETIADSILESISNIDGVDNAYNMIKTFTKEKAARNWKRCITDACYNRKTLKVGMFGEIEKLTNIVLNNVSRGQIEYKILDSSSLDVSGLDVIVVWDAEVPIFNSKIPIVLYAHAKNVSIENCNLATDFAASESKLFFPKAIQNSVAIMNYTEFDDFNETIFINNFSKYVTRVVEKYKDFHAINNDPCFIIPNLLKKYKSSKKVARSLNILKVDLPEGEKEWTYILINEYIDKLTEGC